MAAELTALPKFTNGGTSANPEALSACLELPSQQATLEVGRTVTV